MILRTLLDDVQHIDFLLLLDTELEGHFSPSASLMWPIMVPFSVTLFFFLFSPIYLEYMRAVRVKIQSNLATG